MTLPECESQNSIATDDGSFSNRVVQVARNGYAILFFFENIGNGAVSCLVSKFSRAFHNIYNYFLTSSRKRRFSMLFFFNS